MNFEKPQQSPEDKSEFPEIESVLKETETDPRLKEILKQSFRDLISSNLKKFRENIAEESLSLSMQTGLVYLFLSGHMDNLLVFIPEPGPDAFGGDTVFIDKRILAIIAASLITKSFKTVKRYIDEHQVNGTTAESAV